MGIVVLLIQLALMVVIFAGMWKAFVKAGQPGWAILVPIYNIYVITQIAKKPGWWLLLLLIPIVGFVISIIMSIEIAKNFGKQTGFGIGLALLGIIFWPILGFGDAQYIGATATSDDNVLDA